jgi:hypothetical protein
MHSARKDLARWRQDKTALLIADQDNSLLSGFVVSAYSQDQLGELILVEQVSEQEGESWINDDDASGFLTIPTGFQKARSHIPEDPIGADHLLRYSHDDPPVFLGHYWLDNAKYVFVEKGPE